MTFMGLCPKCRAPQKWEGRNVDDRPPCPACKWQADGVRIDRADRAIEGARASGETATPAMFEGERR